MTVVIRIYGIAIEKIDQNIAMVYNDNGNNRAQQQK